MAKYICVRKCYHNMRVYDVNDPYEPVEGETRVPHHFRSVDPNAPAPTPAAPEPEPGPATLSELHPNRPRVLNLHASETMHGMQQARGEPVVQQGGTPKPAGRPRGRPRKDATKPPAIPGT